MLKWILQDTKRNLLKKKTIILLLVMIISIGATFYLNEKPLEHYDQYGNIIVYESKEQMFDDSTIMFNAITDIDNIIQSKLPKECDLEWLALRYNVDCSQYDIYHSNPKLEVNYVNDQPVIDIEKAWDHLLLPMAIYVQSVNDTFVSRTPELQAAMKIHLMRFDEILDISNDIIANKPDEYEIYKLKNIVVSSEDFNHVAMMFLEYQYIQDNQLPLNTMYIQTGSFFIANYLNLFSYLLVVIGVVLIFDSFYLDYKSGVFKNILTTPTKRYRYLILKTSSAMLSMLTIIIVPLLITIIILYLVNGFDTFDFPIYISRVSLNSFEPARQYSLVINEKDGLSPLLYSTYKNICEYGPVTKYVQDRSLASFGMYTPCNLLPETVNSITLSKYIFLLLAYILLIVLFLASLNSLMSLLFEKSILNLSVLLTIIVGGLILSVIFIGKDFLNFLATSFFYPTKLLMGTTPFTYYGGVIVLSIYTVILIILNLIVIKRKDFSY